MAMRDERFDDPKPDTRAQDALLGAWRALEDGNVDRQQAAIIIGHLASLTGYYNGMTLAQWVRDTGSPAGYETACVERQAQRWVFSQILPFLTSHPDGRSGPTDQI